MDQLDTCALENVFRRANCISIIMCRLAHSGRRVDGKISSGEEGSKISNPLDYQALDLTDLKFNIFLKESNLTLFGPIRGDT